VKGGINVKVKDLLPIGSVVLLKNGEHPIMIHGIKQATGGGLFKKEETFDYISVLWPEGHLDEEHTFLFNHDNIEKVLFKGYDDEERKKFLDELSKEFGEE